MSEAGSPPQVLQKTVVWLLGRASLRAHQATVQQLTDAGVRVMHYGVLASLNEFGAAAQAQIGRRLGIDRSDMVAVLNDLESDGYVSREPDPLDRRRNRVDITPAGRAALDGFRDLVMAAEQQVLTPLTKAERAQLADMLRRIVAG